jgi:hypothetical protein
MAVLHKPERLNSMAPLPMAVLKLPFELAHKALTPIAVFHPPVVLRSMAKVPEAVLLLPILQQRAPEPEAVL